MAKTPRMGAKIRGLRRRGNLTQARLAERLEVSASYLNLIEHDRRPLTAPLLIKLAQIFELDFNTFAVEGDERLISALMEVFGDAVFDSHNLSSTDVQEFALNAPGVAQAVLSLYHQFRETKDSAQTLASRMSEGQEALGVEPWRLPSEEVSDLIQRHTNYFHELELSAGELWKTAKLDPNDIYRGLVRYLRNEHDIQVQVVKAGTDGRVLRRFDEEQRLITLSEVLPPRTRNFQLAHQIGLISQSETIDRIAKDPRLSTQESRTLGRVALANYFAGAVLMPYDRFYEAARAERYDIELLGHRFRASFEQVCHRLTMLQRPGYEGVPFHFIRTDIAGNISKRFSASGIQFARFSGAFPRWNLHTAFLTPGQIRTQLSQMPDGTHYFCIARTVTKDEGGYHAPRAVHAIALGCGIEHAEKLVYSDGMDLKNLDAAVPVGVTCRLCERMDCAQRAFPPLQRPLNIDENARSSSFYAPAQD